MKHFPEAYNTSLSLTIFLSSLTKARRSAGKSAPMRAEADNGAVLAITTPSAGALTREDKITSAIMDAAEPNYHYHGLLAAFQNYPFFFYVIVVGSH